MPFRHIFTLVYFFRASQVAEIYFRFANSPFFVHFILLQQYLEYGMASTTFGIHGSLPNVPIFFTSFH